MPLRFARALDTLAEAAEAAAAAATSTATANGGAAVAAVAAIDTVAATSTNATTKRANADDDDDAVEDVTVGAALTAAPALDAAPEALTAASTCKNTPKRIDTNKSSKQRPKQRLDRRRSRPFSVRANKAAAAAAAERAVTATAVTAATMLHSATNTSSNTRSTKRTVSKSDSSAAAAAAAAGAALQSHSHSHSHSQLQKQPQSTRTTQLPLKLQQCQFDDLERLLYQRQSQLLSGTTKSAAAASSTSSAVVAGAAASPTFAATTPDAAAAAAAADTNINSSSSSSNTVSGVIVNTNTNTNIDITNTNGNTNVDTNSVNVMHELVRASNHRRALMRQACQSFLQSTQLSSAQSTLSLTTVPIVVQQQPLPVNTLLDGAMTTATKNAVPPRQPIETIGTATETAIYRDDDGTDGRVVASVTATAFDFDCRQGNGTAVPANLEQRTEAPTPKSNGSTTLTKPATSNHKQPISPFRSRQSRPLLLVQSLQPNDIVLMGATTSTAPSAAPSAASTSAATSISNRTASLAGRDQTDTATAAAAGAIAATPATTRAPTRRQPQPLRLLPPHDKAWTRHFRETIDYYWNLQAQCIEQSQSSQVETLTETTINSTATVANAREVANKAVDALLSQGARIVAPFLGSTDIVQHDDTASSSSSSVYVALTKDDAVNAVTLLIEQLACRQAQRRIAAGLREGDIVVDTKATARVGHEQLHSIFMLHRDAYCRATTTRVQKLAICSSILQSLQRSGRRLATACPIQRRFVAVQPNAQAILVLRDMMDRAIDQASNPDSTKATIAGPPLPPPLAPICNDNMDRTCEPSSVAPKSPPTMPTQRRCLDSKSALDGSCAEYTSPNSSRNSSRSSSSISSPSQCQTVGTASSKLFNASFSPARRKRASRLLDDNDHAVDVQNNRAELRDAKRLRLKETVATRATAGAAAKASTVAATIVVTPPALHNEEYDDDETELEDNDTDDMSDRYDSDQDRDKSGCNIQLDGDDDDSTVLEEDYVDAQTIPLAPVVQTADHKATRATSAANVEQRHCVGVNGTSMMKTTVVADTLATAHTDHALNASSRFLAIPTVTPHLLLQPQQQQQQPVTAPMLQVAPHEQLSQQQQHWRHSSATAPATIATSSSSALVSPIVVSSNSALPPPQHGDGQTLTLTQRHAPQPPQQVSSPNETADARLNSWIHEATNFVLGGVVAHW